MRLPGRIGWVRLAIFAGLGAFWAFVADLPLLGAGFAVVGGALALAYPSRRAET